MGSQSVNTSDGAHLDIAVNGFWGGRYEQTFIDVWVFDFPIQPKHQHLQLLLKTRKRYLKKHVYKQCIGEVEHSSFTPLVFSATAGMVRLGSVLYMRFASRLAEKRNNPYSCTPSWVRCLVSFSLLSRGVRSSCGQPTSSWAPLDLIACEAQLC